jgi:hypothetical protein
MTRCGGASQHKGRDGFRCQRLDTAVVNCLGCVSVAQLRLTILGHLTCGDVGNLASQALNDVARRRGKYATKRCELVGGARPNRRIQKDAAPSPPGRGEFGVCESIPSLMPSRRSRG